MANALLPYAEKPERNALREMTKASKADVGYSNGMPESHCGICRHFIPPNACEKVAGAIAPDMWCELFKAVGE